MGNEELCYFTLRIKKWSSGGKENKLCDADGDKLCDSWHGVTGGISN
jgi:hypothetical protein